jgi:FAD/FMN-containing dehydrogenase
MIKDKLVRIVVADNVSSESATLEEYSRDFSFVNSIKPECVVRPRNAGEIEKIAKLANETLTPLVPVSSGAPHFKGDTVPSIGGAIIVDLSGMEKIIRIDRNNHVAMCEPGVTFDELIASFITNSERIIYPGFAI